LNIHKDFRIEGEPLNTPGDILEYVRENHPVHIDFLREFFDEKEEMYHSTSGSTGSPKLLTIPKKDMLQSARMSAEYFSLSPGTKALLCLSSGYIAGKMMWVRALVNGWDIYPVPVDAHPLSHTNENFDFGAMVPLQVENSLDAIDTINTLIIGGAPLSHKLENKLSDFSQNIYQTYGMTETLTHIAVRSLSTGESVFSALPGFHLEQDERGCLVIHTPYSHQRVATNDVVELLDDTHFTWLGRYDFVINSGGIKLFPELIERKLEPYLPVNFFIHGFPDEKYGTVAALVMEGSTLSDYEELKPLFALAGLHRYEYPKSVYYVKSFIYTENGKINRLNTILNIDKFS
jgi:O-succinylbenzoic acid--CoA ligase